MNIKSKTATITITSGRDGTTPHSLTVSHVLSADATSAKLLFLLTAEIERVVSANPDHRLHSMKVVID